VFGVHGIAEASAGVRFEGRTDPAIIADMAESAGLDPRTVAQRGEEMTRVYLRELRAELVRPDPRRAVTPGVFPLLDALRSRPSVRLGLITGNIEPAAREKLRSFALDEYFPDGGFASDHEDRSEIARIARERVSRRTGIPFEPAQTVVVGDTEQDVTCARDNGYAVILVETGWIPRERLVAARPDALFEDFRDLHSVLAALGVFTAASGRGA
jgi:phosphoglycolate phosphatase-like HAD superfamily hydrolase